MALSRQLFRETVPLNAVYAIFNFISKFSSNPNNFLYTETPHSTSCYAKAEKSENFHVNE
jgi:hypothetical protein